MTRFLDRAKRAVIWAFEWWLSIALLVTAAILWVLTLGYAGTRINGVVVTRGWRPRQDGAPLQEEGEGER